MLCAALEFTDFAIIAAIVAVLAGRATAARSILAPVDRDRLARIEQKLDLLLTQAGVDYAPPAKAEWQAVAEEGPARKIAAIKAYRDHTGAGLAEAKRAGEEYMEGAAGVTPNQALQPTAGAGWLFPIRSSRGPRRG